MQKTHSRGRTILLSVLMVLMCVSLIIGATFALFTDKEEYAIGVNTGNIDVEGTLEMTGAWSQGQSVADRTEGTAIDNGFSLPQGGTVTLTEGKTISFDNISLGDGAAFTLRIANHSSVNMKYSVRIETEEEGKSEALAKSLQLSVDGGKTVSFEKAATSVVDWTTVEAGSEEEISAIGFEITLPWDTIDNFAGVTGQQSVSMTVVLEAVQANAFTGTIGSGDTGYDTIYDAMSGENDGNISLGSGITAQWPTKNEVESLAENGKAYNIVGAGQGLTTIEPADGEDAIVLPANSSVSNATIDGNVVAAAGSVLSDVEVTGTVIYAAPASGQSTFSALAKVSAANARTIEETVTLRNATVSVKDAQPAISVDGAILVIENSTVTLSGTQAQEMNAILVKNGAVDMDGSTVTVTNTETGNYAARALYIDNTALDKQGTTNGQTASVVSHIDGSALTVDTESTLQSGNTTYERYNEQAVRLEGARAEFSDTSVQAGHGIAGFYSSTLVYTGGSIDALWYGVSGNNLRGSFDITLDGVAVTSSKVSSAIYLPMQNTTVIKGGTTIEAFTPLEIRMGHVTIDDATLISTSKVSANLIQTNQSSPDGSVIVLHAGEYTFNSPEGYKDPYYEVWSTGDPSTLNNMANVTLNKGAVLVAAEGVRTFSWYDWNEVDQTVQVNNYTQYPLYGIATNAAAFETFYKLNLSEVILAKDIEVGVIANVGKGQYLKDNNGNYADATVASGFVANDVVVDLNGHTLTSTQKTSTIICGGVDLTFKNGELIFKDGNFPYNAGLLNVQAGSVLTVDDVDVTTLASFVYVQGEKATLNIINGSTVKTQGYGFGTNAKNKANYGVVINVSDSEITSALNTEQVVSGWNYQYDTTAACLNVPGTMTIKNSTLSGQRHGVVVRGGTAIIEDSTIISTGEWLNAPADAKSDVYGSAANNKDTDAILTNKWGSGTDLPCSALLIGNDNTAAYNCPSVVTLKDVEIVAGNAGQVHRPHAVYIRGNETAENGATLNLDTASDLGDQITVGGGYVTVNLGEGSYTLPAFSAAAGSLTINGVQGTVIAPATHASADFGGIVVRDADGLALTVRNVAVEGTDKTNGARGIVVNEGFNKNVTLTAEGCKFGALSTGIYLGGVTDATVTGCSFTNCTAGMGGTEGMTDTFTAESCTFADNGETIGWAGSGTLIIKDAEGCDSFMDYTKNPEEKVTVTDGNYNSKEAAA